MTEVRRKSFPQQKIGEPEKRAFVMCLAEGWCVLFPFLPSGAPGSVDSPFTEFVRKAWEDVVYSDIATDLPDNDQVETFSEAIRTIAKSFKQQGDRDDKWRPEWLKWTSVA